MNLAGLQKSCAESDVGGAKIKNGESGGPPDLRPEKNAARMAVEPSRSFDALPELPASCSVPAARSKTSDEATCRVSQYLLHRRNTWSNEEN